MQILEFSILKTLLLKRRMLDVDLIWPPKESTLNFLTRVTMSEVMCGRLV